MRQQQRLGIIWLALALLLTVLLLWGLRQRPSIPFGALASWPFAGKDGEATSDTAKEHEFAAEEISLVKTDLQGSSLSVEASQDGRIRLSFLNGAEAGCTATQSGGRLVGTEKKKQGRQDQELILRLPSGYSGMLKAESVGGRITVTGLSLPELAAESVGGAIQVRDCGLELLEAESVSGAIRADGKFGQLRVETVSGAIDIASTQALRHKSKVESVSGAVRLCLPERSDYSLQFESASGTFTDSITGTNGRKQGSSVNGTGSVTIAVETVSGALRVEKSR